MKSIREVDLGFKPVFYLLNLNRNELNSIAIEKVGEIQYEGISFKESNLGWSLNPTKIGRGFISLGDFDFTENFEEAKIHASNREDDGKQKE